MRLTTTIKTKLTVAAAAACVLGAIATGCAGRLPEATGLPPGAVLVAETPDFLAGFTAQEDGTIYIFHRGKETFLRYSGPIKRGARFTIDPETNAAKVDNEELDVVIPGGGNHYQVYFRPAPGTAIDLD
jgi:hypothetical protein